MATVSNPQQTSSPQQSGPKGEERHPALGNWIRVGLAMLAIIAFFALMIGLASLLPEPSGVEYRPLMLP